MLTEPAQGNEALAGRIKQMTPTEGKAQADAHDAARTGTDRVDVIAYYQGALMGRYGPVSQAGQDSIKQTLRAMGAFF